MPSYIGLAVVALVVAYVVNSYRKLQANVQTAKQSTLPYIVLPVFTFNRFWLVTHPLWLVFIRRLPPAWTQSWLPYVLPNWIWDKKFETFKEVGSGCVILSSPGNNMLHVADAEAIVQITTRRSDFPKPIGFYRSIDIFGKNVVTTEGAYWRHHRKITSPPFTEKNNHLVWNESLHQAQSMMAGWVDVKTRTDSGSLKDVATQAMRLSLHVISRAGFGVRLEWPHEEQTHDLPAGHTLTYKEALEKLLENIITVMLTPRWILRNSPLKFHKIANEAFVEWGKYMRELYEDKRTEVKKGEIREGMDLMGALVKGAGITADSPSDPTNGDPEKATGSANKQLLTDDEILGNAFVFILAGHETAANTIHFSILYLAMHRSSQKRLQEDLDAILGERPIDEWDYDSDVPKLFGSMCGAVMNEELRLIPPVIGIPKSTAAGQPQGLNIGGKRVTIPGGSMITLNTAALHRNPKYWPHTSEEDLDEFRPERWLLDSNNSSNHTEENAYADEEGLDFEGPDKRPDTAASLYRPPKGAYIPFSDGYRSCLGRRFAQVEILAVLAVIFKTWSVELDVSAFMADEEVNAASESQKREAWNKADARARDLLKNGMWTIITIQMRKDKVPLRFVKRGSERFKFG